MLYRITIEVGKIEKKVFIRTSYKEEHILRFNIGRSLEHIIRTITRKEEQNENKWCRTKIDKRVWGL